MIEKFSAVCARQCRALCFSYELISRKRMSMYNLPLTANNTGSFEKAKLSQNSETINRRHKMKATGIVRRIDDLGRVVIPKEIRRTLRIRMGAPSLIRMVLLISFGITTRPKSSILLTIPVAFILLFSPISILFAEYCCRYCLKVQENYAKAVSNVQKLIL